MKTKNLVLIAILSLTGTYGMAAQQSKIAALLAKQPLPRGAVRVPEEVIAKTQIRKVDPVGPNMCIMCAHVKGTVVLLALIDKNGRVNSAKVLSGPAMLKQPVLEAVRQWRYHPYLVNLKPVAVQTTITVIYQTP
jgi:periplasmic protein TonB